MAEQEIAAITHQAAQCFPLFGLTVIHRYGRLNVGEEIVLVLAASQHRAHAFEAADFIMDHLKTDVPFWKKAHFNDGRPAKWLDVAELDIKRRDRWK